MQKLLVRAEAIKDMFSAEQLERIVDCANLYITLTSKEDKEEREALYDIVLYTVKQAEEQFAIDKSYLKSLVCGDDDYPEQAWDDDAYPH